MTQQLIALLKAFWGGHLIQLTLSRIDWTDKTTGEAKYGFVYTSNPRTTVQNIGPSSLGGTVVVQGQSSSSENNITIWLDNMDQDMFLLYKEQGYEQASFNLDTQEIEFPTESQVQSDETHIQA